MFWLLICVPSKGARFDFYFIIGVLCVYADYYGKIYGKYVTFHTFYGLKTLEILI